MEVNLLFLLCFTLYLRAIFHVQAPPGAYIWRGNLTEGFCVTGLGGLHLEGLIHGRAYFPNLTVFPTSTKSVYLDLRKDFLFLNKINMVHTISDKQISRIFQGQITVFKE